MICTSATADFLNKESSDIPAFSLNSHAEAQGTALPRVPGLAPLARSKLRAAGVSKNPALYNAYQRSQFAI